MQFTHRGAKKSPPDSQKSFNIFSRKIAMLRI